MDAPPPHKPPNGWQTPQPDTGMDLNFGPGGQMSVASENNTPQPAPAPSNQAPLQVQSAVFPSAPSSPPGISPGQPQRTSPVPQLPPSDAPTPTVPVLTVTPVAPSSPVPPSITTASSDPIQPLSNSTSVVIPVSTSITSVMLSMSTSISVSTVIPTSTTTPEDVIEDNSSSSTLLETSAAVAAISAGETPEPSQMPSPSASASASSASSSSSHGPPFYVGIVLGTIVVVALLAALIAWGVRLRTHARRRSENSLDVPWAKPGNNDGVLEEGRHLAFSGSRNLTVDTSALDFSSQDAMAHAHTWEPRGDRDVGEPRRVESCANPPVSPYRQPTPPYDPFSDHQQYPRLADSAAYPLPAYNSPYMTTRGTPSHMTGTDFDARGSVDDHSITSSLGPLQVANMAPGDASASSSRAPTALGMNTAAPGNRDCGTPREDMGGTRPRFLGLQGEGLEVPWANTSSRPGLRSFGSRRSRMGSGGGNWEHLPSHSSMPNDPTLEQQTADRDGWTAALKSNLMNAFNAVAANLPSGPTMEEAQESRLTPTPSRQAADRSRSGRHPSGQWNEFTGDPQGMAREGTTSSNAFTLEDNGDGTGTVHFRGLDEGYRGGDHMLSPQATGASISLTDGDRSDVGTDLYRPPTQDSQTPLIVTRKPKSVFLRPDIYSRLSNYGRGTRLGAECRTGSVSRASSVYSMASGTSSAYPGSGTPVPPRIPAFSRHSTMTIDALGPASKRDGANHERPVNVSRLSSSGCSFSSYRTDGTTTAISDYSGDEEAVRNAITDRRKRLRRVM